MLLIYVQWSFQILLESPIFVKQCNIHFAKKRIQSRKPRINKKEKKKDKIELGKSS